MTRWPWNRASSSGVVGLREWKHTLLLPDTFLKESHLIQREGLSKPTERDLRSNLSPKNQLRSQTAGVIDEFPGQPELAGQLLRQGPHTKGLRRIVPSVKDVDSRLFCQGMRPVRAFARNKGIHPHCGRLL